MQSVSATFSGTSVSNFRNLKSSVLVSWDKTTASGIQYFTIGQSIIGGQDSLKSTAGGTIALANQYKYTTIPASGVVSWNTSMKLDQFPYGLVQRQADIVLSNADERLLPASGTALGPYMLSGRPVIIQAGFGNDTIPLFTGYSDSPVNDINNRTVSLHCYDAIDYLNSYNSKATGPQLSQKADAIIGTLLAEAGFSPSQYVLEGSLNPAIPYLDPFGLMIGDVINKLCEAEGAIFFADESGIMHFWNRQHFSNNANPVTTLTYSNMATLQQQNSPIINYAEVQSSPLALISGARQVYSLDQSYYIQANGANATNGITNPSFEVSTSGWTGTLARTNVTAQNGAGSWSASGTNMVYDISSLLTQENGGTGYTAAAQFGFRAPIGATGLATLSGVAQVGQSIAGTQRLAISGTNQWQQFNLAANHFNLGATGTIGGYTHSTPVPASEYLSMRTVANNGYLYVASVPAGTTNVYYAKLSPNVGSFSITSPLPATINGGPITNTASGIWVIGGTSTGICYCTTYAANGSLNTWSGTAILPTAVQVNSAATYNGYVYSLGGQTYGTNTEVNNVYYAPINSDQSLGTWQSTTNLTNAKSRAAAVAYNGYLYTFGGADGIMTTAKNEVRFASINANGTINAWNPTTSLPIAVWSLRAIAYGGYMFIFGGEDQTVGSYANSYAAKINSDGTLGSWSPITNLPIAYDQMGLSINGQYFYIVGGENVVRSGFTVNVNTYNDIYYNSFGSTGASLTISGAKAFYLDAVSNDIVDPYFDGDSTSTNTYRYAWSGPSHNSASNRTALPNYLTVKCALNSETYSIVQPTASGLNAANIGAQQSYYSFSSVSGTGGIYGQDLTSNISLVNYSVSGTTAFLTFQNNSSQQAYLTNLVLYGQVAQAPTNINQFYLDQNSINNYRLNPTNNGQIMNISNSYIPTTAAAQGLAQYLVTGYSTPYLKHTTDTFSLPQLQFGDCVNLFNQDTGETRKGYVVGIQNSLDSNANLKQTLIIQERNLTHYFTIGSSSIGGSDAIAP